MRVSGEQISIGGSRWVVHGRAALTVMDELEVCELIGSVERELGRVHAVAQREHAIVVGRQSTQLRCPARAADKSERPDPHSLPSQ
jgi:hypothetical protein